MSLNFMARKQWMGIEGSPANYSLSAHSPINNTMMSVGGGVALESFGISKIYNANVSYAYLLPVTEIAFLSLGLNVNYSNMQLSYSKLDVLHQDDPYFNQGKENANNVFSGFGAYLFSRSFFLGLSASNLVALKSFEESSEYNGYLNKKYYNAIAGYLIPLSQDFTAKPTVWYKYITDDSSEVNYGLQVMYQDLLWMGCNYNDKGILSNMVNFKISNDFAVAYTFETSIGNSFVKRNNHEIALSYRINSLIDSNPKREFGKRESKKLLKSLRNF